MGLSETEFNGFMKVHLTFGVMMYLIYLFEISTFNDHIQKLYSQGGFVLFIFVFLLIIGGIIYSIYNIQAKKIKQLKTALKITALGFLTLLIPLGIGIYESNNDIYTGV